MKEIVLFAQNISANNKRAQKQKIMKKFPDKKKRMILALKFTIFFLLL
jgi:hypothetical protein